MIDNKTRLIPNKNFMFAENGVIENILRSARRMNLERKKILQQICAAKRRKSMQNTQSTAKLKNIGHTCSRDEGHSINVKPKNYKKSPDTSMLMQNKGTAKLA